MKILITVIFVFLVPIAAFGLPKAKITGKAVDENDKPIINGKVFVVFSNPTLGAQQTSKYLATDDKGEFEASGECYEDVGFSIDKEGFYQSSTGYKFQSRSKLFNRWLPWNPIVKVVLKKKRNPKPVYRKYLESLQVPVFGQPVGYDFEKGDWVAPFGVGTHNDLIFNCQNSYTSFTKANSNCDITFSNQYDGLQEYEFEKNNQSLYRWPYEAPASGYEIKKINIWMSVDLPSEQYKNNYRESINYIFRLRTQVDHSGNVVKAKYGKIIGDFRVYKKGEVNFTYSYNPDGTKSLEEGENLFSKKRQQVEASRTKPYSLCLNI